MSKDGQLLEHLNYPMPIKATSECPDVNVAKYLGPPGSSYASDRAGPTGMLRVSHRVSHNAAKSRANEPYYDHVRRRSDGAFDAARTAQSRCRRARSQPSRSAYGQSASSSTRASRSSFASPATASLCPRRRCSRSKSPSTRTLAAMSFTPAAATTPSSFCPSARSDLSIPCTAERHCPLLPDLVGLGFSWLASRRLSCLSACAALSASCKSAARSGRRRSRSDVVPLGSRPF